MYHLVTVVGTVASQSVAILVETQKNLYRVLMGL